MPGVREGVLVAEVHYYCVTCNAWLDAKTRIKPASCGTLVHPKPRGTGACGPISRVEVEEDDTLPWEPRVSGRYRGGEPG